MQAWPLKRQKSAENRDSDVRRTTRKGRGAASNHSGRFESEQRLAFDDGWGILDEEPPRLTTTHTAEKTRTIVASNQSPDLPFDRSVNPYKGCEHGCAYCFARPSHAFLGMSPGLDFESRLVSKPEAPDVLRRTFSRAGYQPRVIALGVNTDAYQPLERRLGLTRKLLEVMRDFRHPVALITKSNLILRDLDLLSELAEHGLVTVMISITTLDRTLARRMEPRAPTPWRRLDAIESLASAGVPVGVLAAPVIPGLSDHELEAILEAAAAAGASAAEYLMLRLPGEVQQLFTEWLRRCYPNRAKRVLQLIRGMRGGLLHDGQFGRRMTGTGPYADLVQQRFALAARRLGIANRLPEPRTDAFICPRPQQPQLSLFGPL